MFSSLSSSAVVDLDSMMTHSGKLKDNLVDTRKQGQEMHGNLHPTSETFQCLLLSPSPSQFA